MKSCGTSVGATSFYSTKFSHEGHTTKGHTTKGHTTNWIKIYLQSHCKIRCIKLYVFVTDLLLADLLHAICVRT